MPKGEENAGKPAKVRVGIDVGGTFTHAIAIDAVTLELVGKAKVPTTHTAPEGVARGIIQSLATLLKEAQIAPENVTFIAHSTTQATNALLEGDVATVGIIGMGAGANAWLARMGTNVGKIELAPGKFLTTHHRFIDTTRPPSDEIIEKTLDELLNAGAKAIAISEAFSVDAPENEERALAIAQGRGLLATTGSEVSQLYGLKVRTRTAVINASMLPRMLESANMTEKSVREAGIRAPLMIMRSDGGVMDIEAMRRRPILTMLSGPAAGVAAAMMFLHISDGIFLEVGGTSTDISAITNGKAKIRSGEVGGHRVYTHTLDVRTVGVAGGSIPRMRKGGGQAELFDVGPRSAHIAGLKYVAFTKEFDHAEIQLISPLSQDPGDYVTFAGRAEKSQYCLTPTCASNFLGLVPEGDPAFGNREAIASAIGLLAKELGSTPEEAADRLLALASQRVIPVVKALIKDHKLDPSIVSLIGGGGGAAAIVPYLGKTLSMRHQLAQHADVISAIGVALALIRETVERQIVNPTNDDILRVREEARNAVLKMGADVHSIDIHVELDSRANIVRATASGSTSVTDTKKLKRDLSDEEKIALAAESLRVAPDLVSLKAQSEHFSLYGVKLTARKLFGLLSTHTHSLRVIDQAGNIRLQVRNGEALTGNPGAVSQLIARLVEEHSQWGDAGKVIPAVFLLVGPKIVDLSGLLDTEQVITLAQPELENQPQDAKVIVIASTDRQ